ncbi:CGNR zinc finger domain-containing protein [Herbiconiux sp. CPCC 203407]|uniref:CGNR zinc finger domain-containing protein n=1 Tax=Herbiconiux oxytropis TaxID=2970915 RepID=A0AA41XHG7_9MICO|nr:CGNR zinc finger domain-containing protein [Herbiconiux oxytropis]MCS5723466.1 CGNR zinc finger domain-containing protein [Herbiconiux oxytropis]MCS5726553.1 CGNR zinc finger domain-containing protein [Herbiconiux oxytropis]
MLRDEELLLTLLNSAPVIEGVPTDGLDGAAGQDLARSWGGTGSADELARLRRVRQALQTIVRDGDGGAVSELAGILDDAVRTPRVTPDGVIWELQVPEDDRLAAGAVLAWSAVITEFPGRLRACANHECSQFLVDHSRPGTAKWCSMAVCGNRMKARTHARRAKS